MTDPTNLMTSRIRPRRELDTYDYVSIPPFDFHASVRPLPTATQCLNTYITCTPSALPTSM